jgi:hypothetical protein
MSLNFKKKNGKERQNSGPLGSATFEDDEYAKVIEGIKRIYKQKIKPVEATYNFEGKISYLVYHISCLLMLFCCKKKKKKKKKMV